MQLAAAASDAGNREEAYRYFTKVLEVDASNHEAWFGKALAAGWGSGLRADRFAELTAGLRRAIELAPEVERELLKQRAAREICSITTAYFRLSVRHTAEFIALENTWAEHVGRCVPMLTALSFANTLAPQDKQVIENVIELAKAMIEGVQYDDPYDTYGDNIPKTKEMHLSPELEATVKKVMDEFVAKLQALDPAYQAPKIRKAGEIGAGCWIGCLVIVVLLGLGAFWIFKSYLGSGKRTSNHQSSERSEEQVETTKKNGEPEKLKASSTKAPDCLTSCKVFTAKRAECVEPFTARLKLSARDKADVIADHKRVADGRECRSLCGVMAKKLIAWGECGSAATCDDFVKCYGDANGENPSGPAEPIPAGSKADCTPCSSQEDFDAAMKAGSKCCPVMGCAADVDCTNGRVCCKIPGGQLCGDESRCKGVNRVER